MFLAFLNAPRSSKVRVVLKTIPIVSEMLINNSILIKEQLKIFSFKEKRLILKDQGPNIFAETLTRWFFLWPYRNSRTLDSGRCYCSYYHLQYKQQKKIEVLKANHFGFNANVSNEGAY